MTTTRRESLIRDAKAAGFTVTTDDHGNTSVFKERVTAKGKRRVRGVTLSYAGWALDLSVDAAAVRAFRGYDKMRKVLGI